MLDVQFTGTASITESAEVINSVFDKVDERLKNGKYLVGDSFTAADLAFASLCYPIVAAGLPEMWKTRFPPLNLFPKIYQEQIKQWMARPAGQHAIMVYREHRFSESSIIRDVKITNPNPRNNVFPIILLVGGVAAIGCAYMCRSRL